MQKKHKVIFSCVVKPLVPADKDKYLALASIEQLKPFLPDLNPENVDLLPIAFNACLANRINLNSDGVDGPTAIAMAPLFINKPINVDHDRKRVVGTILTAGFSEFGTDKPLTAEQVKDYKQPFNITLGGVVWRVTSSKLADFLEESSDPSSPNYLKVSASWELGFDDYDLLIVAGNGRNFEDGIRISDPTEISKLQDKLKANGGNGKTEDSKNLYRIVKDDVLPLGIGLTEEPAADVKGILAGDVAEGLARATAKALENANTLTDSFGNALVKIAAGYAGPGLSGVSGYSGLSGVSGAEAIATSSFSGFSGYSGILVPDLIRATIISVLLEQKKLGGLLGGSNCNCTTEEEYRKNHVVEGVSGMSGYCLHYEIYKKKESVTAATPDSISQSEKANVKSSSLIMKISTVNDITDESLKTIQASTIQEFLSEKIKEYSQKWEMEKNEKDKTVASLEEAKKKAEQDLAKALEDIKVVQSNVYKLQKEADDRLAAEKFQQRMAAFDEEFNLDDEDRKTLGEQIKALDDETFATYQKQLSVLFRTKKKAQETVASRTDKQETVDSALDNATRETGSVTNTTTASQPTTYDKYKKAFSKEGFVIKN